MMANIRSELCRHVWVRVQLHGEGPHVGKNLRTGIICKNCRAYRYGEDPDRPVTGCLTDVDVSRLGKARNHDYTQQESRLLADQDRREIDEEIALGARDRNGRPILG